MHVSLVCLALAAYANAASIQLGETTLETTHLADVESKLTDKPVVVIRKTTYYEPELVAVIVERGVDDVPEDRYLIENYADVLSPENKEILLCRTLGIKEECLGKTVTKLLVPEPFKSVDITDLFQNTVKLPWVSTIDKDIEVYDKPKLVSKPSSKLIVKSSAEKPAIHTAGVEYYTPVQTVSPQIFRYINDAAAAMPAYRDAYSQIIFDQQLVPRSVAVPHESSVTTSYPTGVFRNVQAPTSYTASTVDPGFYEGGQVLVQSPVTQPRTLVKPQNNQYFRR